SGVVFPVEVLVLDETEATGLEGVVLRVAILNVVAGGGRRSDRVTLFVLRDLAGKDPLRRDRPFVAQRIIASAEILTSEVSARIAVERVVVIVDRAGVDAWILQERADQ